ncbi:myosin-11-like isoform X2 [Leptidea sinapis]|uniref:myosin-11-like isoform X2 n=1 Tax=Leptidea sinapis TaxID=189913 RepID=UPI0021C2D8E6|nr:myosin-11-like isoform X2 [Leptidea sinapis]
MFNFFKRKPKADAVTPETSRKLPTATPAPPVEPRTPPSPDTAQKDVVNLLIPDTSYTHKTSFLNIMGRKKRNKRRNKQEKPSEADKNSDDAAFVKAIVLQKYAPAQSKQQHVSREYDARPSEDEKRRTEALLTEIAKHIDCSARDEQMGTDNSKEPLYETVDPIDSYKNDLKDELEMLLNTDHNKIDDNLSAAAKKSSLKPPKVDEGCSDDDRSDNGKKRVTFQKRVIFDDGDEQTDEGSSFESLTSEETEYLDDVPDNDELLGGYIVNAETPVIKVESVDHLCRGDNSDSGFLECDKESGDETSDVKSMVESEDDAEIIDDMDEESDRELVPEECETESKDLVSEDSKLQKEVSALSSLADSRCEELERARDIISSLRREVETKEQEIEQLKCELAAAYKESELIRQRSRALEDEVTAARTCSADLADQLTRRNDEAIRQLKGELQEGQSRCAALAARVDQLEEDKRRLQHELVAREQRAQEELAAAEANTNKWRLAHEAARSQAAARAERILADCEWKMRELEKRARDTEREKRELTETVEQLRTSQTHKAELQQLRGLAAEQQRSVQSLATQLERAQASEEELQAEVHALEELMEKMRQKEVEHAQEMESVKQQHSQEVEALRAEQTAAAARWAASRAALDRAHADALRSALAALREDGERDVRNAERKLRETNTRFENLKEVLASKESEWQHALADARSQADWELLQLRHLLDKADINYANNVESLNERHEKEIEQLTEEWSTKVRMVEEQAQRDAEEARKALETTRAALTAERLDVVNKLKAKHQQEMDEQWEQFMTDKENCLERMKAECRQEGDEHRAKREKQLLEEIAELKTLVQSKSSEFEELSGAASAIGRTLAVTEQELREALEREKALRGKREEDENKLTQVQKTSREQIEHLTRKCACLRKLFDDMRARLSARERTAEQASRVKDKEIHTLKAEVARLTKILVEQSSPKLGTRTRADGCETTQKEETSTKESQTDSKTNATRRKGI